MIAQVLRGGDAREEGLIHHREAGGWAIALSKGLASPARKTDPNEDSCGVVSGGGGVVAVVADAHYGRASSEIAVERVLAAALRGPLPWGDSAALWAWMTAQLEESARVLRGQRTSSACAVLVAACQGPRLWWVSIGDCRLYRVGPQGATVLNPLQQSYLDGYGLLPPPEAGEEELSVGDRVVLASDGLPECTYGIETFFPDDVGKIAARGRPAAAAEALIQEALRRGGEDNIAVAMGVIE